MPELPEVQTTVSCLQLLVNKKINSININTKKLRYTIPINSILQVKNKEIIKIYRIAKYIIFEINNNFSLIFHLGMSGRMKLLQFYEYKKEKHDHIVIKLSNDNILIFNDPRKFGFVDFSFTSEMKNKKYLMKLGADPFEKNFNRNYLFNNFKKSKASIKQLLLNQKIVSGIGNIYACEILFDAKISPFILGNQMNKQMINKLIVSTKKILTKAISQGGSTLRNYMSADGTLGNFQNNFKVYNRENTKIGNFKIRRIKQSGRSTYFCPKLQRSKFNPKYNKF